MRVPLALSRFVESVRTIEPPVDRTARIDRLPDGRTQLVFRVIDGRADVTVAGTRRRAHFKRATGLARAVIVQLKPGWSAAVLGVAASELTDRFVPLDDLWGPGGSDLCAQLVAARDAREAVDQLAHALAARVQPAFEPASAPLARRAVRMLEAEPLRVDGVAARLGVTARHLRRAFTESIGIGPKAFARGARLRRAVQLATTSTDWGHIAAAAGYCDQSHLIADFRDLVGLTPSAFARATRGDSAPASSRRAGESAA